MVQLVHQLKLEAGHDQSITIDPGVAFLRLNVKQWENLGCKLDGKTGLSSAISFLERTSWCQNCTHKNWPVFLWDECEKAKCGRGNIMEGKPLFVDNFAGISTELSAQKCLKWNLFISHIPKVIFKKYFKYLWFGDLESDPKKFTLIFCDLS